MKNMRIYHTGEEQTSGALTANPDKCDSLTALLLMTDFSDFSGHGGPARNILYGQWDNRKHVRAAMQKGWLVAMPRFLYGCFGIQTQVPMFALQAFNK